MTALLRGKWTVVNVKRTHLVLASGKQLLQKKKKVTSVKKLCSRDDGTMVSVLVCYVAGRGLIPVTSK